MQEFKTALWTDTAISLVFRRMAGRADDPKEVGRRLELTRLALKYPTQKAFSDVIPGMTPQKWNNYVSGRDLITVENALILCNRYGITTDWIYRGLREAMPSRLLAEIEALEAAQIVSKPRRASKKP